MKKEQQLNDIILDCIKDFLRGGYIWDNGEDENPILNSIIDVIAQGDYFDDNDFKGDDAPFTDEFIEKLEAKLHDTIGNLKIV